MPGKYCRRLKQIDKEDFYMFYNLDEITAFDAM